VRAVPVLGIVGGIGSGKSVVADALQKHGGYLIAADQLGHAALRQPDVREKLVRRWGKDVLDCRGEAERKKIAAIVFANPLELRALEAIVFPYIERRIAEEVARAQAQAGVKFIILDAAILLESGWHRFCDKIVFVDAPRDLRLARLAEKRGWNVQEVERREQAQMPLADKQARADVVIVNDADFQKVAQQVQDALERWDIIC
jgi:dephospho-CoA kinase